MDKPMSTHKASEQQTKVNIKKSRGVGPGRETGRDGDREKGGVGNAWEHYESEKHPWASGGCPQTEFPK